MASSASATAALDGFTSTAPVSMATAVTSSLAATTATAYRTFSGVDQEGIPATTVVPALGPYETVYPPTNGLSDIEKIGDHSYNLWTLTNNPFYGQPNNTCDIGSCNLVLSYSHYLPNLEGTVFLLALFALLFIVNLPLGILKKTWGFMVGMAVGCGLEVAGYTGRYLQRTLPFEQTNFLLNIICLTIGPAFITASIYLCLARIIVVYGQGNARFKPQVYTVTFMLADFLSLVLQGAGGGIASTADPDTTDQTAGINTMIAGLVLQVASLTIYIFLCADIAVSVIRGKAPGHDFFEPLRRSLKFKAFLASLAFATITIFIRCCYRVAELRAGFSSDFANNEVIYSILESAMVGAAALSLTVFHPGLIFGNTWAKANFSLRGRDLNGGNETGYEMSDGKFVGVAN